MKKVSVEEFVRDIDVFIELASKEPIALTEDGRPTLVAISAEEYARLKARDQAAVPMSPKSAKRKATRKDILARAETFVAPWGGADSQKIRDLEAGIDGAGILSGKLDSSKSE